MNISPDYLIERRRSKWSLARWKFLAFALFIIILIISRDDLHVSEGLSKASFPGGDHIASIKINDVIMDDLGRVRKLNKIAENDNIKAVIVNINSPGGSVVGSEMLYDSFRKIAKSKPIVVVMGSMATSGGYLASLGADHIIAHNGTLTGSIGVIMQSTEVTELAEMIGVKFNNFKSSSLKASPNFAEKLTPEVEKVTMDTILEVYDYFAELVSERRGLDIETVKQIADGRIYSGRKALELKLIDAIGNEDTAIKWLREVKEISKNLEVVDIKLKKREKFIDMLMEDFQTSVSGFFSTGFNGLKSII